MVPFGFSQVADVANKVERCPKITEMEGSFDAVAIIAQFPVRRLRFSEREPRNASGGTFLLGEHLGHVWTFGRRPGDQRQQCFIPGLLETGSKLSLTT